MRRGVRACFGRKRHREFKQSAMCVLGLVVVLPNIETRSKMGLKNGVCQIASNASLMNSPSGRGLGMRWSDQTTNRTRPVHDAEMQAMGDPRRSKVRDRTVCDGGI